MEGLLRWYGLLLSSFRSFFLWLRNGGLFVVGYWADDYVCWRGFVADNLDRFEVPYIGRLASNWVDAE